MARYNSYKRGSKKKWSDGKKVDILEYSKNLDVSINDISKFSESRVSTAIKVLTIWHTEKVRLLELKKENIEKVREIEQLQVLRQKTLDASKERLSFLQKLFGSSIPLDTRHELDRIDRRIFHLKINTSGHTAFQISSLEKWINQEEVDRIGNLLERLKKALPDLTRKKVQREEEKLIRERIAAEKKQLEKAAAYFDNTRAHAEAIKRQIRQQMVSFPSCPYCFRDLGNEPNADHIHPVSRGGLSTIENMVYICKDCNSKKYNLTLREFVLRCHLDRDRIENILDKMGKRF